MFGSNRRQERREKDIYEAAVLAASMRPNFQDALREVLDSSTHLVCRAGAKIEGSNGSCSVSGVRYWSPEHFLVEIERLQGLLGQDYKVVGGLWTTVEEVSLGVAMERLGSFNGASRSYTNQFHTKMVEVTSAKDLENISRNDDLKRCWINIKHR